MTDHLYEFWRQEFSKFAAFAYFVRMNGLPLPLIYIVDCWRPIVSGNTDYVPSACNDH